MCALAYVRDVVRRLTAATDGSRYLMLKSYFDIAGTGTQHKACTCAGFAGDENECDRVASEWNVIVKPIGEFHALEFFPRNENGGMTGIYKGISVRDAEACVFSLIDLLASSSLTPIGMALHAEAFRTLHIDERRWLTTAAIFGKSWPSEGSPKKPYIATFIYCLHGCNDYTPDGDTIYVTLDLDTSTAASEVKIYNQTRKLSGKWGGKLGESLLHSSRHKAVLLQAADLLAYSINWSVQEVPNNRIIDCALAKLAINKSFVVIMDTKQLDLHLQHCPFRRTFWSGMTDPDFIEQLRSQDVKVLACKMGDGSYRTHTIDKSQVKIIQEFAAIPKPLEK
jgi:hypothetical protein